MSNHRDLTLGIDAGGTFTDLVLLEKKAVIAKAKAPTTHGRPAHGIAEAINRLPQEMLTSIRLASLSTTFATNAMVEGKGGRVAALLSGYSERDMNHPSFADALAGIPHILTSGGHDSLGNPLADLDEESCIDFVKEYRGRVDAFAVSSYFAPRNPEHENRLRDMCRDLSGLPVSCGHELSAALNAPRRAVTCIVNARLVPLIDQLISDVETVLREREIAAPLMVVTGSGTMLPARLARLRPVETILSGPASGVVGACSLTGLERAVVVDMGGTTTDVALVENGRALGDPRGAVVGNVETMVSAVRVRTIGLGGDSAVTVDDGTERIGPRRVIPLCRLENDGPVETDRYLVALPGAAPAEGTAKPSTGWMSDAADATKGGLDQTLLRHAAAGPLPWNKAAEIAGSTFAAARAAEKLVQSNRCLLSGFTPTDALVALGRLQLGDRDAALFAARRHATARESAGDTVGAPVVDDQQGGSRLEKTCETVISRVSLLAARAVLAAVLDHDAGGRDLDAAPQDLAAAAIPDDAGPPGEESRFADLSPRITTPMVGIGAPAGAFLPAAASLLHTTLVMPENAEVAGAVGAAVARVYREASVVINYLGQEKGYRLHGPETVENFEAVPEAIDRARSLTRDTAYALAIDADADPETVDVFVEAHETTVMIDGAPETLTVNVRAEATGNAKVPRL